MIKVDKINRKRTNYFITDEEARILWQYSKRWGTKFQVMAGLALFRGMRIGEIVSTNIYDFQNEEFQKLNIILEKSHILDEFPILKGFNGLIKEYVMKNRHLLKDGYLFPFYISRRLPHMSTAVAVGLFCKMRQIIGKDYPEFLDRQEIINSKGKTIYRYRISWHTCRRWFETRIWEHYKDKMLLRDLMRYKDSKTIDVYINPYETWKKESDILNSTFGGLFDNFNNVAKGQTRLNTYINT